MTTVTWKEYWASQRLIFWPVFLTIALLIGVGSWNQKIPVRVQHFVRLLHHPHARIASDAWNELKTLALEDSEALSLALKASGDEKNIAFLVERGTRGDFTVVRGRPNYYKTPQVYCYTVGEAILAIAYDRRLWRADYAGSWDRWWQQNKPYYVRSLASNSQP